MSRLKLREANQKKSSTQKKEEIIYIFYLLKCALQNQSLKAHYKAGNIFVGSFWHSGVKGCLEPLGIKPRALRFTS